MLVAGLLIAMVLCARTTVDQNGIVVRSMVRTTRYRWPDIAGLRIERAGLAATRPGVRPAGPPRGPQHPGARVTSRVVILHIMARADYQAGQDIRAASLYTDGFAHCSDYGTVHLPADRLFAGRTDLVLVQIDPATLEAPLRWEPGDPPSPDGVWFPHVYGTIPAAAVVAVHDFPPSPDGTFRLPPALAVHDRGDPAGQS